MTIQSERSLKRSEYPKPLSNRDSPGRVRGWPRLLPSGVRNGTQTSIVTRCLRHALSRFHGTQGDGRKSHLSRETLSRLFFIEGAYQCVLTSFRGRLSPTISCLITRAHCGSSANYRVTTH